VTCPFGCEWANHLGCLKNNLSRHKQRSLVGHQPAYGSDKICHRDLFIFDQSSAHASLLPDALKAFEMNKSEGGKQHNTEIPQSNPDLHFWGQPQKMMTSSGQQKGLQAVLEVVLPWLKPHFLLLWEINYVKLPKYLRS